jgi:hypothetical protein
MSYLAYHQLEEMGLIILDPYGEISRKIASIAGDRLVYVDKHHPLTINCLKRGYLNRSERARELADAINASVSVNSPGQVDITVKMFRIISNAIETIDPDVINLKLLSEFLDSKGARDKYFAGKNRPDYWQEFDSKGNRYEQLRASAERVADRFYTLYNNETLEKFVMGPDQFDLFEIMEKRKVVCFNLEGMQGEELFYIGNLVTHAIKTFLVKAPFDGNGLGIYIDEFHLFLNKSFQNEFTKCLKKNINFVVSHHNHSQTEPSLLNILLGSCYLKVCLQCEREDAKRMAGYYQTKPDELDGIGKYHAFLENREKVYYVKTFPVEIEFYTPPPAKPPAPAPEVLNFLRHGTIPLETSNQPG